jgi:hypothetical protein
LKEEIDGDSLTEAGRESQMVGAATLKALAPKFVETNGLFSLNCWPDLRSRAGVYVEINSER